MQINFKNELLNKIKDKTAKVTIVGAGYVGLPLAVLCAEAHFETVVIDIDKIRVEKLANGISDVEAVPSTRLQNAINCCLEFTSEFYPIGESDVIILCVPTPLNKNHQPDLSYIQNAMESVSQFMRSGQLLILESTSYPGTTEEILVTKVSTKGYSVGEDYFIGYSPEREDPGNEQFTTFQIPKVVSGYEKNCLILVSAFYEKIISKIVPVSSTKTAEFTKLFENIYRSVNISLVNETKMITDRFGVNIHEVIEAAGTKPFGFTKFHAGPGVGGHCIPIDPFYLSWKAKEFGLSTKFIDIAGEINNEISNWIVQKIIYGLNEHHKSINGSDILLIGMAYKKDIGDWRESPAIEILQKLRQLGASVRYCDPLLKRRQELEKRVGNSGVNWEDLEIKNYDAVVVVTDHSLFDYNKIRQNARLIIDTRNVYKSDHPNVIRA